MFKEEKNLKDITSPLPNLPLVKGEEQGGGLSYTKTNKLITALYMVTDIIDRDEPLRNKLRTLGTGIISDINSTPFNACSKISEIMSFLDIASAVNIISEMNCSILKKEFLELDQSIKESTNNNVQTQINKLNRKINLSEFFNESNGEESKPSIGHFKSNSIGVQKGHTLLKALSKIELSNRNITDGSRRPTSVATHAQDFDIFKKQRRNDIISIIKTLGGNATIKDIKDRAQTSQGKNDPLVSCSEKTLQRELISMVKDNVLNKTGEKRWSRYFLIGSRP